LHAGCFENAPVVVYTPIVPKLTPEEIKILPAYTLEEAARYVGAAAGTLRAWFRGRPGTLATKGRGSRNAVDPILPTGAGPREPLSFIDLIEAHVLFEIRRVYHFPRKNFKRAMEYLSEGGGDLMLLAHENFYFDHTNLFLGEDAVLLSLSERGQLVDKEIMAHGLRQITYGEDGFADQFFPRLGKREQSEFVVNPSINYGRLSIARLGVGAEAVAARYKAHEKIADIAEDYGATENEVVEAILWHDKLQLAA
jgi:uncharacterized protein (DUF433 family)